MFRVVAGVVPYTTSDAKDRVLDATLTSSISGDSFSKVINRMYVLVVCTKLQYLRIFMH